MSDLNLRLTDAAAKKVGELILGEENLKLKLRVYITGGGCSGFQYGFTFDEEQNPDDFCITKNVNLNLNEASLEEVVVLVDSLSFQYLQGAEIDYQEGLEGAKFVIRNPNAKTTCGCGSSFSA